MAQRTRQTFPPVTLGHIRGHGCRNLLVYCGNMNCNHGATMNANYMPDDLPIGSLCPRMVCTAAVTVRPDWSPHINKRHV
jgi:hypothetical protein